MNKTPGESQDQRDQQVLENKKKVNSHFWNNNLFKIYTLNSQMWYNYSNYNISVGYQNASYCRHNICCLLDALANMANHIVDPTKCK